MVGSRTRRRYSRAAVRATMRANRSGNTKPDRMMAAALSSLGFAVVRNAEADVVVRALGLAVFVHGCFWHGCPEHWRPPATNRAYWVDKVRKTRRRDKTAREALQSKGWTVIETWEHDVVANAHSVALAAVRKTRE